MTILLKGFSGWCFKSSRFMNILVTGAAGYIGSVLTPYLLQQGHRVIALDVFRSGAPSLMACVADPNFTCIRGDVREPELMKSVLKDVDVIIPLAAVVGAPACSQDPTAARTVNLDAIELLVQLAGKQQRILYPTTNSGYGIGGKGKPCTEDSPLRPISLYGRTKVDAEKAILDRGNCITFRLATIFGTSPRMRLDLLVNDFTWRAVTDRFVVLFEAHFKRNYMHVRDVARVFQHGLEKFELMKDKPFNAGLSDANLSKLELCQAIQKHVPTFSFTEAKVGEDPDKRDYMVSNARLEATGFRPTYSLDDGIRELIRAYQMIRNSRFSNI